MKPGWMLSSSLDFFHLPMSIESQLKEMDLFRGLTDEQLAQVAAKMTTVELGEGEILFSDQVRDERFYVVLKGQVRIESIISRRKRVPYILSTGNFFGAESYLYARRTTADARAVTAARILRLEVHELAALMRAAPQLLTNLKAESDLIRLLRSGHFDWLNPDEKIYLLTRKHPLQLWVSLGLPALIALGALLVAGVVSAMGMPPLIVAFFGLGILAIALGLGFWRYLDWSNDYYVITSQRAVWLERVIWLYDSRREAPINALESVDFTTTQFGRILGYGDLIVHTFSSTVEFRNIGEPRKVRDLLESFQKRAKQGLKEAEVAAMERTIRQKIGFPVDEKPPPKPVAATPSGATAQQPATFWLKLNQYFKLRIEQGGVIIYHKHWFILLRKVGIPSLVTLATFIAIVLALWYTLSIKADVLTVALVIFLSAILLAAPILWWAYQYIDWRNDIYQITADKIIASEKKPLGDERTQSAPLEHIQSLEHERLGLLGLLFNFGNVKINISSGQPFVFYGVHDPARTQQDIFARMYAFRRRKEEIEAAREHERVANWVAAYHRQIADRLNTPNLPQSGQI
jgi:hypothetical protein